MYVAVLATLLLSISCPFKGLCFQFQGIFPLRISNQNSAYFLDPFAYPISHNFRCEKSIRLKGVQLTQMAERSSSNDLRFSNEISIQLQKNQLYVRPVAPSEVDKAFSIEATSYPEDEAATLDKLKFRQQFAGEYFLGMYDQSDNGLLGFVCGTCCDGERLTEEAMSEHISSGENLCIHSVVISEAHRRKGYATLLLKSYIETIAHQNQNVKTILLIAKAHLLRFYVGCGFTLVGLSDIVHGKDPWFEMKLVTALQRALPFVQVSAFTRQPFAGNPAAVFFTHGSPEWMQKVAGELRLSETAFVTQIEDGSWHLRWFTPTAEVDLCGHATLASAHALWETGRAGLDEEIKFTTLSGVLTAKPISGGWIELDFPEEPPTESPIPNALVGGLGLELADILYCGRSRVDYLVEVTPESFQNMQININRLEEIETRGIIATCRAGKGAVEGGEDQNSHQNKRLKVSEDEPCPDFESRFFGPRVGVDEDPVTGSAHCCLGPYWSGKLGALTLTGYQKSERGGVVKIRIGNGDEMGRIKLLGQALTCFTGSFNLNSS